ncbi:MAG: tripeptide aminopeptidase PepT, partial [Deltaproteobacteria bacterium]|nr:tripeptide aminopeptidase PepT [Deltaproteobacteria bacterium]
HTIMTSDGTTLLGGDDKAGLAALVELVRHYKENKDDVHGDIRIAIIPDEEIGVGTERLDLKKFGCDVAYTVDGGVMGEIDVESFNGFKGKITVDGYAAFPGYGKGIYINAIQILSKMIAKMEDKRWPQNAAGRDPIWWIHTFTGDVAKAEATVFLRDFELDGIKVQEKLLNQYKDEVLKEFPKAKVNIEVEEMYKNYKYELEKDPRVVDYAKEAMQNIGIEPEINFVRGGNDSCHLCFSGLLSTNLFIGMQNMHSLMEWNTVETIEAAVKTLVSLAKVWVDKSA